MRALESFCSPVTCSSLQPLRLPSAFHQQQLQGLFSRARGFISLFTTSMHRSNDLRTLYCTSSADISWIKQRKGQSRKYGKTDNIIKVKKEADFLLCNSLSLFFRTFWCRVWQACFCDGLVSPLLRTVWAANRIRGWNRFIRDRNLIVAAFCFSSLSLWSHYFDLLL